MSKIECFPCPDDARWHELRAPDITASVAPALLGIHEYKTAFSVYQEKTGAVKDSVSDTGAVRRGRLLEPVAVQVLREDNPSWAIRYNNGEDRVYYREAETRLGATPDVEVVSERGKGVVQIKSVAERIYRQKWCANGAPEPPLWIAVQTIIEATLTGSEWAAVMPLVVDNELITPIIDIPLNSGVMDRVRAAVADFWDRVARNDPYPPDYKRDGDTLLSLYGSDDGSTIDLTGWNQGPELAAEDARLAGDIKIASDRRKAIKAELLDKMGSAAVATIDGRVFATAKTVKRKGFTVDDTEYRNVTFKRSA